MLLVLCGRDALKAEERIITLKDALRMGLESSLATRQMLEDEAVIHLMREKTEESKLTHELSLTVSGDRNEIGDARDLDSTASDTKRYNLSYKQTYEGGFSLTTSVKKRISTPVEGDDDEEDFSKLLMIGDLPVYGKSSDYNRLVNEKTELSLNAKQELLNRKRIKHQNLVAETYLDFLTSFLSLKESQKVLNLIQQSITLKTKTKTQVTELEIRELHYQLLQEKQKHLLMENNFQQSRKKLAYLIGETDNSFMPDDAFLPSLMENLDSLKQKYLALSDSLWQLRQDLSQKEKDYAIKDLELIPDISLGLFAGKSQTLTETGNNYGVYLTVGYQFWGGEEEDFVAVKTEIESMKLSIKQKEVELLLQAETDFQKMEANKEIIKIQKLQKQLANDQVELAETQYKIGRTDQSKVLSFKIKAAKTNSSLIKSRQSLWKQVLKILKNANVDLLAYMDSSS